LPLCSWIMSNQRSSVRTHYCTHTLALHLCY
jgi:hypothetical protein